MADAGHMANDSLSILMALIALYLSTKNQGRMAVLNGASLMFVAIYIMIEAVDRWNNPQIMDSLPMLTVAVIGLLVNIYVAWLMLKGDQENLNLRAAYLHVLADLLGSVVAIAAGLSAFLFGWMWVDTVASFILSLFIFRSGFGVTRRALDSLKKNGIKTAFGQVNTQTQNLSSTCYSAAKSSKLSAVTTPDRV